MSFLAPAAFALAALIPVLIAMYLLKLRRTEQEVSSVYLWRRMVRDVEANAPWQKLRRNLLLIVQLLFLAAIVVALARPVTWVAGVSGPAAILIFDTSASMAAVDVAPNRLEAAKAEAQRLVDGLADSVRVTVIAAGEGAQVRAASSQDRRQVRLAIQGIEVGTGGSDLSAALGLASAIAARQPDTEIVVFSDGRVSLPERMAIKGQVRYMPMGISGENQAIGILSLQAAPGGGLTAFVQVSNYGSAAAQRRLSVLADGQLVNAYDLEIPPGGQQSVVVQDLPLEAGVIEARLGGEDALPLDDRAWAVHRSGEAAAVTLVSEGNLFLETALALFPDLAVTTVKPEDYEAGGEGQGVAAAAPPVLTILDSYVPITASLPTGNLLFVGPLRSTAYFSVTGQVQQPVPRAVSASGSAEAVDPLLAHVNLSQVSVLEAARVPLPLWARPVIAGDVGDETVPLLLAGEVDGRRIAVLTFDLRRSDLPLQVAFPLLLANLANWLAPSGGSDLPTQIAPGAPVAWSVSPDVESAQVTRPDGAATRLAPEGGRVVFADTAQLGVYGAAWGDRAARFAVNLFAPLESDLRPAAELALGGTGTGEAGERSQQARREWWRPLAFAALALLVAEWGIYQRATLARLWAGIRQRIKNPLARFPGRPGS